MTISDTIDQVDPENISLVEAPLGYNILVRGERAGAIEGYPGKLDYVEVESHWEDKGVARAAINEFIEFSQECGVPEVATSNATNPIMGHILETEGFEEVPCGWKKGIERNPDVSEFDYSAE